MTKSITLALFALGGLAATGPALAQGATGAVSRPGWSAGQAPSSDFNRQGTPMTRNEQVRRRAAAARAQAAPATKAPLRAARRPAAR
ncbi:hypothetical protein [Roseomonas xinghualingensis]|uniref:hypothetical protein n=1 Tax=Roseomonas xinghualingensis TaxID=2986475 RepID=UPI0021F15890|nr:hypothetical protein [Roseomonas sp. SXEYE001]MCV4209059.1 hypothetical protein [Roseomonas sp. SXEYE001]